MRPTLNPGLVEKIMKIKELVDKFGTIIVCTLWILSTLWDIIKFQKYWSDYMMELYSDFLFVFMILHFVLPLKIPKIITELFGVITNTLGRSIVMLVFSLLFVGDKHLFHNLASIFMLLVGLSLLVMEFLAPSEGGDEKKNLYPQNNNNSNNAQEGNDQKGSNAEDSNPPSKLDDSQPGAESIGSEGDNHNQLPSLDEQIKQSSGESGNNNGGFDFL